MQNGFRRLALAQGLLPDRLPQTETAAPPEPNPTLHSDAQNPPPASHDDGPERWAVSAA